MVAEHAATGNDHLELVGLVGVRPGDGARPLLDQEGHRVQRIVGRGRLGRGAPRPAARYSGSRQ